MKFLLCLLVVAVICLAQCQAGFLTKDVHRYWNPSKWNHFYTTDLSELGYGKDGYRYEGVRFKMTALHEANTVPLYRYWNSKYGDHFYTTDINEIGGGRDGWYKLVSIAGLCYPSKEANTIPLYRYWNSKTKDHFYTTDATEIGTTTRGLVGHHGYKSEGIACYVYSK